jgi:hypothetical protein
VLLKTSVLFVGIVLVSASPVLAADDAFKAGAATFQKAQMSKSRPSEQSDFAYCAGYWDVWSNAANDGTISEAQLALLPIELRPPSTSLAAMAMLMMLEDEDTVEKQIEPSQNEARDLIAATLDGHAEAAESLFHSLGICQIEEE